MLRFAVLVEDSCMAFSQGSFFGVTLKIHLLRRTFSYSKEVVSTNSELLGYIDHYDLLS